MIFTLFCCTKTPAWCHGPKTYVFLNCAWRQLSSVPIWTPFAVTPSREKVGPDLLLTVKSLPVWGGMVRPLNNCSKIVTKTYTGNKTRISTYILTKLKVRVDGYLKRWREVVSFEAACRISLKGIFILFCCTKTLAGCCGPKRQVF